MDNEEGSTASTPAPQERSTAVTAVTAVIAVLAALLLFTLVIGRWMTTSFEDWVPLEAPEELPAGIETADLPASASFECSPALGGDAEAIASDQAVEAVTVQELSRAPCDEPRDQRRVMGFVNLAVIALLFVGTLVVRRRQARPDAPPQPVDVTPRP